MRSAAATSRGPEYVGPEYVGRIFRCGPMPPAPGLKTRPTCERDLPRRSSQACLLPLERARARENARQRVIPFVTRRLVDLIGLLVQFRQRQLDRPRACEGGRILDGDAVRQQIGPGPGVPLGQMQVFARSLEIGLVREIRHLDDERVALPPAARVVVLL